MQQTIRFGGFEVDLAAGLLCRRGVRVNVRDKSLQLLLALLERPGVLVSRQDLRGRLWRNDVFVDFDNNLNSAIAALRRALGDSADRPRYIETVPRRGYRFIARLDSAVPGEAEPAARRPARLVVLPFLNLNADPEQEYFGDAVTEEVTTELAASASGQLGVIARTTAMRYRASHKDVAQIGRELKVDFVVEGGVRREGNGVAITVQLIRVADQMHLLARRYEAAVADVFNVRNEIAGAIATALGLRADEGTRGEAASAPAVRKPTEDVVAYHEYIQGRYQLQRGTPEGFGRARAHFEAAIARDPKFALAHADLAELYSYLGYFGHLRPIDAFSAGIWHALEAVRIDDRLAEAHAVLAEFHKQLDYDWPAARREMARALELNPASPVVRTRNAVAVLMPHNQLKEAIGEMELALVLDPLSPSTRTWLGVMLLYAREYDRAIEEARRLLDVEPTSCWAHFIIGIAYRQKYADLADKTDESATFAGQAIGELETAAKLAPGSDLYVGWLGHALGVCGREEQARAALEQLYDRRKAGRFVLPSNFAWTHLGLGEIDAAFEWLDRAVDERDQMMMPILSYAHLDPLRDDPRFARLLTKMKLQAVPHFLPPLIPG